MPQLLGADGLPVKKTALTREIAGPTIAGVRSPFGQHVSRGLTPERLARLLRSAAENDARDYLELAEEMEEKDLHYLSVIGTRKRAVTQLDIRVEPASDAAEDTAAAELVEQFLARDELEDELFDIMDAVGKGYSVTEIIWETSERQWMPERLEWRMPQWFEFDRETGGTLMLLGDGGQLEPLLPFKFICHKVRAKSGLAIRGGLARAAAWAFLFKAFSLKDWVTFAEVYGQPIRVGKYHAGATQDERDILLRAVASIGSDAAAIIPETMLIEFVKAEQTASSELYARLCDFLDRQVSKAVVGQTMTTDDGSSLAQAKVHDAVREDIERADAKALAATLNRDLVRPLVDLNLGPRAWYPRLAIARPDAEDIPALGEALAKLVPLGLKVKQSEVRQRLGLDEPDPADELLAAPAPQLPPAMPPPVDPAVAQNARGKAPITQVGTLCPVHGVVHHAAAVPADSLDALADLLADEWEPVMEPAVDAIRQALDDATGLEDFRERLAELLPRLDLNRLAERLARGRFAARLAGDADAPIRD